MSSALSKYEAILIVQPDLQEEALSKLQSQFKELVSRQGGQAGEWVSLGRRKLSYRLSRFNEGIYLQCPVQLAPSEVAAFRKGVALMESVLRLLVLRELIPFQELQQAARSVEQKAEGREGGSFEASNT